MRKMHADFRPAVRIQRSANPARPVADWPLVCVSIRPCRSRTVHELGADESGVSPQRDGSFAAPE